MGNTNAPSFSCRVGKRGSVQKSNSAVSSKADSEIETIVVPLSECNINDIVSRLSSSSHVRQRKLHYELAVKKSSRIYNERISMHEE